MDGICPTKIAVVESGVGKVAANVLKYEIKPRRLLRAGVWRRMRRGSCTRATRSLAPTRDVTLSASLALFVVHIEVTL